MSKELSKLEISPFEKIKKINEYGSEYWSARDLMEVLEYSDYRNFLNIINKAIIACENSGENKENHFGQVNEMVDIGSNAKRERENYYLSRYACYLIVQNADSSKKPVALGQSYFAIQTRKQEINELELENKKRLFLRSEMKAHNSKLADAAKNAGVKDRIDYAIFQNYGYKGLYGGFAAKDIHERKNLKKSQDILDHMGSTELAANLFRATQTEEKLRRENIRGKQNANNTHLEVGKKVRQTIKDLGGTMPEDLPSVESIKKIEKKQKPEVLISSEVEFDDDTILFETKEQISATNTPLLETSYESIDKEVKEQVLDIWKIVLQSLKSEGKVLLYANLVGVKAEILNDTLNITLPMGQTFSETILKKPENMEYLKLICSKYSKNNIKLVTIQRSE